MSISYILLSVIGCLLPSLFLGIPLSETNKHGRIIGGEEATIQQFPHQVSLQRNGSLFCGGIVIHKEVVLTAAHCVNEQKPEAILVRAGSSEYHQGGILLKVRSIISHEAYNLPTPLNNDIALIILDEPLTFSRFVRAIPLITDNDILPPGSNLYVSGWGSTSQNVVQLSPHLRYTIVHEIDHARCVASYSGLQKVTATMMCAGVEQGGRDSCRVDSGGPLIAHIQESMQLIGIVSWGISCADSAYPGVYTRVLDYKNWIREHIKEAMGFEFQLDKKKL